jgi:hypothetical protein
MVEDLLSYQLIIHMAGPSHQFCHVGRCSERGMKLSRFFTTARMSNPQRCLRCSLLGSKPAGGDRRQLSARLLPRALRAARHINHRTRHQTLGDDRPLLVLGPAPPPFRARYRAIAPSLALVQALSFAPVLPDGPNRHLIARRLSPDELPRIGIRD